MDTGFKDKRGRKIHVGDLLQVGMGVNDPDLLLVIHKGGAFRLVNADKQNMAASFVFTEKMAPLMLIVDRVR